MQIVSERSAVSVVQEHHKNDLHKSSRTADIMFILSFYLDCMLVMFSVN